MDPQSGITPENPSETVRISPLSEFPEYAPILAFWSYRRWYLQRNIPFQTVLKAYQSRASENGVPKAFVATVKTMPAGMVSLKPDDLWSRKDLNPWLASLYVLPEFRKRGIGEMLVKSVIEYAASLKLERIYLFLDHNEKSKLQHYYRKLGWEFMEGAADNDGHETEIYTCRLRRGHTP